MPNRAAEDRSRTPDRHASGGVARRALLLLALWLAGGVAGVAPAIGPPDEPGVNTDPWAATMERPFVAWITPMRVASLLGRLGVAAGEPALAESTPPWLSDAGRAILEAALEIHQAELDAIRADAEQVDESIEVRHARLIPANGLVAFEQRVERAEGMRPFAERQDALEDRLLRRLRASFSPADRAWFDHNVRRWQSHDLRSTWRVSEAGVDVLDEAFRARERTGRSWSDLDELLGEPELRRAEIVRVQLDAHKAHARGRIQAFGRRAVLEIDGDVGFVEPSGTDRVRKSVRRRDQREAAAELRRVQRVVLARLLDAVPSEDDRHAVEAAYWYRAAPARAAHGRWPIVREAFERAVAIVERDPARAEEATDLRAVHRERERAVFDAARRWSDASFEKWSAENRLADERDRVREATLDRAWRDADDAFARAFETYDDWVTDVADRADSSQD